MDLDLASLVADVSPWIIAAVGVDGQAVLTAPATDEAVGAPVRLGRQILQQIFRTRGQAPPPQAIADLAAEPQDPDLQAVLRVEIRKALTRDPQLAQDIREMLAESPAASGETSDERPVTAPSANDVAIGGEAATSSPVASIFLSHAHEDNDVAHQLTVALAREGVAPWLDAQELYAGEELLARIAQALARVDYFALLLTRAALTKRWVLAETRMALTREIEVGRPKVLILLLEDCEIPVEFRHKLFLDFRGRFDSAVAELVAQVQGADLAIPMPKQAVLAEMIANADAELWARLQAGLGSEEKWEQDEAANVIRDLRTDELEAAVAIGAQWTGSAYKAWEDDIASIIRRTLNVSWAAATRMIGRLVEHGFLEEATDLDYTQESTRAWCSGSMLWILKRAARRSGLFPALPPPVPERLSSLLAYESELMIIGKGWYAVRFDAPMITAVNPERPAVVGISRQADPQHSWIFRGSGDYMPLTADRFFTWVELVPENPFAASGETELVGFGLPAFDDLGLLRD